MRKMPSMAVTIMPERSATTSAMEPKSRGVLIINARFNKLTTMALRSLLQFKLLSPVLQIMPEEIGDNDKQHDKSLHQIHDAGRHIDTRHPAHQVAHDTQGAKEDGCKNDTDWIGIGQYGDAQPGGSNPCLLYTSRTVVFVR